MIALEFEIEKYAMISRACMKQLQLYNPFPIRKMENAKDMVTIHAIKKKLYDQSTCFITAKAH
jgi:hypothetical protein